MGSDLIVFVYAVVCGICVFDLGGRCVCVGVVVVVGVVVYFLGEVFLLYAFCDVGLRRSELLCISVSPL